MSTAHSEAPETRVDQLASNARTIAMSWYVPLRLVCFALFVWVAGAHEAFSASRQVVVLYDERTDLPGLSMLDASLVNMLVTGSPEPIDVYRESMDLSRFDSAAYRKLLRDYLRTKYSGKKIDLVISVFGPTLRFLLSEGDPVFPGAPIVFCGLDRKELGSQRLPSNVTGVFLKREFLPTLELALRLHPDTERVVFVGGTAEFDSRLVEQAKQEFRAVEDRVQLSYLTKLPLNKLLTELSQLPPHSIILYSTLFQDGSGEAFVPHDVAERISVSASVPVYGFLDQYLGRGIVGGSLYSVGLLGEEAARLSLQVLSGVRPSDLAPLESRSSKILFDARQLQRWGISESQLPPEAVVMFRPRSFSTLWGEYRTYVTGSLVIVALLASLIVGLLVERFWRKRAQAEVKERQTEVTHLTRVAILGEFSGALAHELNQPLTAILSNAQAAQRMLATTPVDLAEVREILNDISNDDMRASHVIKRLHLLMKKGEVKLLPLNLNDLANDVLELVHTELDERNVAVKTHLTSGLPDIRGDRVQLQQVLLNLIMNACEAMSDTDSGDRSLVVSTAYNDNTNLRLTVADRGPGISSDLVNHIFEPFVTTKAQGLGLGLSICHTIVRAHGGRLWVANNPDRGASFFMSLPIHAEGHA